MLSGKYRSAWRRFLIFDVSPLIPHLNTEYSTIYGFASGPTDLTSTRADFSFPIGMRTIDPRSVAEALIWFGASKCGSRRRYQFTLAFSSRQISLPCVRMRSTNCHAVFEIFSVPFGSQKIFFLFFVIEIFVCMPLPLTPTTGLGRKLAVMPICLATWRQISLYNWI